MTIEDGPLDDDSFGNAISARIRFGPAAEKIMSADDAAALIRPGDRIGMSGFTGSGYPKEVPAALARRIRSANESGQPFTVDVWTGASTAPELDGALAAVDGINPRLPYQSDAVSRGKINAGLMDYLDLHLSEVAQMVWEGFFGHLDVAVIEVAGITALGQLIPSSSVGNNKTWIDQADRVILEVNSWLPLELSGMHDIYYGTASPPNRKPEKIAAIVITNRPDRDNIFKPPDSDSELIAGYVLEFLQSEVTQGRLPPTLLPLQSGVGNIANAVWLAWTVGRFGP